MVKICHCLLLCFVWVTTFFSFLSFFFDHFLFRAFNLIRRIKNPISELDIMVQQALFAKLATDSSEEMLAWRTGLFFSLKSISSSAVNLFFLHLPFFCLPACLSCCMFAVITTSPLQTLMFAGWASEFISMAAVTAARFCTFRSWICCNSL